MKNIMMKGRLVMKKIALAAALAGLLLFSSTALADEQQKNDGHSDGHSTTQVQPTAKQEESKVNKPVQTPAASSNAQSHNMSMEEHQKMNTGTNQTTPTDAHQNMTSEEHQNMNMGTEESGGHGHGNENVVETPPNIPVLSTFAAINVAFLLIGIWTKWFRKKGGALA